jgi:demethylmenaquinone methyltransferase/2-methoxy-6-polyprenyl-1,4-benzoquinol methylase
MPADGRDRDPRAIRAMFGRITPTYDRLNLILSGAMDRRWRAAAAAALLEAMGSEARVLDVAAGTGDLARAFIKRGARRVVGVDFTEAMLRRANEKYGGKGLNWIEADGLALPFADAAFDAAGVAFGLRNMIDRRAALAEMTRVVRPGGRVGVLEFSQPRGRLTRRLYDRYSSIVLPRLGRRISGTDASHYLRDSIREFWTREELAEAMREAGLTNIRVRSMAFGAVALHLGERRS